MPKPYRPLGAVRFTAQSWEGPGDGLTAYTGTNSVTSVRVRAKTLDEAATKIARRLYGSGMEIRQRRVGSPSSGWFGAFKDDFAYGEPFHVSKG